MKNQYVGDIGDYGKYSLLRAFIDAGVKVGVNWYLTEDDGSNDGKFRVYLEKDEYRKYSPIVYDELKKIVSSKKRTIKAIEKSNILPGAYFFSKKLNFKGTPSERTKSRYQWLWDSIWELSGTELVFLDPDNGLYVKDNPADKCAEKYVLPSEVLKYWETRHNVVYYCHRGRRTEQQWQEYMRIMRKTMPGTRVIVITFHKGTQRSFVFLVRKMHFEKYRKIIDEVLKKWDGIFSDEAIEDDDLSAPVRDQEFVVYNEKNVALTGAIRNRCLRLESFVYGKDYDSEKYYDFTEDDTKKLFSKITIDDFIKACRDGHLMWLEEYLKENDIKPKTFCI